MGYPIENGSGPILLKIEGREDHNFECIPYAIAACNRHFMAGERSPCTIIDGHLTYTINVSPNWNGVSLP